MRAPGLLLLAAATAAPLGLAACSDGPAEPAPEEAVARPPDILLVVMDTVRADATSAYGAARPTTPQLEDLARQGVRWDQAWTPGSWTWPVHASLFTGAWPWEHGAHFARGQASDLVSEHLQISAFPAELPTLAERLAAAGYRTSMFTANRLIGPGSGAERGFEVAQACTGDLCVVEGVQAELAHPDPRPRFVFANLFGAHGPYSVTPASWSTARLPELTAAEPAPWLAPFILEEGPSVRLFEPVDEAGTSGVVAILRGEHEVPPEGWTLLRDLYDGEVTGVDYFMSQLVRSWTGSGRSGVIAVTSDHGEYFGEHGLVDHGRTLFPEVLHVPLVVVAPGRLPAGEVVEAPVSNQHLHGTLLDLAGLPPQGPRLPLAGQPAPGPVLAAAYKDPFLSEAVGGDFSEPHRLYREGDLVLLLSGTEAPVAALYDLAGDPGMTRDLAAERPGEAARLRAALEATIPPLTDTGEPLQLDPSTVEQLEAMGYVSPGSGSASAPPAPEGAGAAPGSAP